MERPNIPDWNDLIEVRWNKLQKMRELGINPYRNDLQPKATIGYLRRTFDQQTAEQLAVRIMEPFSIAGRVMAVRTFGKGGFIDIQDDSGKIQLLLSKKDVPEAAFRLLMEFLDEGDFVYAKGQITRTRAGELTLKLENLEMMAKALRPLPAKFHGLADVETRYRHRTVDLISNPEVMKTFKDRSFIIAEIRRLLTHPDADFIEAETPMLHSLLGGAAAKPFRTHHNALDMPLYLRIAPELYLKRLVAGGFHRVFEIGRQFRNEGLSTRHNPEFTSLELYQAFADFRTMMNLMEWLISELVEKLHKKTEIEYQGQPINFTRPWPRLTLREAVIKYTGQDIEDPRKLIEVFETQVEWKLIQPTFITHYPVENSPLARRNDADPRLTDRFELFISGREIGNAYSELNDPSDQRQRLEEQAKAKASGNEEACDLDQDFLRALEQGMPPTAGMGIGIDRLVMLLTNSPSIRDVILFPQMRAEA